MPLSGWRFWKILGEHGAVSGIGDDGEENTFPTHAFLEISRFKPKHKPILKIYILRENIFQHIITVHVFLFL